MADRLAEIYGVECHEVQVGFKYVGPMMVSTNAILGGEESGGFGFRGHIPERDGVLAGLYFADMIVRRQMPLSAILATLYEKVGPHAYNRRDIRTDREGYDDLKRRTYERFAADPPGEIAGRKVERIRDDDGFKFYFGDGAWVLIRFSGTEPLMRVYSEAATQSEVEELIQALVDLLGVQQ
jgi:phosphomannomutase